VATILLLEFSYEDLVKVNEPYDVRANDLFYFIWINVTDLVFASDETLCDADETSENALNCRQSRLTCICN